MTGDPDQPTNRAARDPGGAEQPQVGRLYDYLLGGGFNIAADRQVGDEILAVAPEARLAVQANRAFLARVVRYALRHGVTQFLDLGCGLPSTGNVHQIAHALNPQARVVYVDVDPLAVQAMTAHTAHLPTVAVVWADLQSHTAVLSHPDVAGLLDWDQPVAVLLVSVLHFLPGDLTDLVQSYVEAATAGSLLAISHVSSTTLTDRTDRVQALYEKAGAPVHVRSPEQIRALFTGLDLIHPQPDSQPGAPAELVPVARWRPDEPSPPQDGSPFLTGFLAGLGRKPDPATPPPATPDPLTASRSEPDGPADTTQAVTTTVSLADTAAAVAAETADPDTILYLFGLLCMLGVIDPSACDGTELPAAARRFIGLVDAQTIRGAGLADAVTAAYARCDEIDRTVAAIDVQERFAVWQLALPAADEAAPTRATTRRAGHRPPPARRPGRRDRGFAADREAAWRDNTAGRLDGGEGR